MATTPINIPIGIAAPPRELRFRRTPLTMYTNGPSSFGDPTELWTPIFRGRFSEHDFLGYFEARPELADAMKAAQGGSHTTGHAVVGYARIQVLVLEAHGVADLADDLTLQPLAIRTEDPAALYLVFNATDGVYASPDPMPKDVAEEFMLAFRKRFEAQGFYATANGCHIPAAELVLELQEEGSGGLK